MFEFKHPKNLAFPSDKVYLLNQIQAILKVFHDSLVGAVVGGGILRDLLHGRSYKDIDLFAHAKDISEESVIRILTGLGFQCSRVFSDETSEYLELSDVSSVTEATHPSLEIPLQIVRMYQHNESGEQMIERLDLGLCQVGMDHRGIIWTTDAYDKDSRDMTFTVTRLGERDIERSKKRFDRLVQKYPGWKLVTP